MTKIYCIKCKQKTKTKKETEAKSKNGRDLIKGLCGVCGRKKNLFVSPQLKRQNAKSSKKSSDESESPLSSDSD